MSDILDGVAQQVSSVATEEINSTLDKFRFRLKSKHITRFRKVFERDLDACIQSSLALRSAGHRHIEKMFARATADLIRLRKVIANYGDIRRADGSNPSRQLPF